MTMPPRARLLGVVAAVLWVLCGAGWVAATTLPWGGAGSLAHVSSADAVWLRSQADGLEVPYLGLGIAVALAVPVAGVLVIALSLVNGVLIAWTRILIWTLGTLLVLVGLAAMLRFDIPPGRGLVVALVGSVCGVLAMGAGALRDRSAARTSTAVEASR